MSGQGPALLPANISPPTGLVAATHPAYGLLCISLPTATANRTVLPPAWVPHRATALGTYSRAITQCSAPEQGQTDNHMTISDNSTSVRA